MLGITDHVQVPKMTELNFSFFFLGGGDIVSPNADGL